ncbi:MAG: trigger factor [Acidobacteria bacterium]|nr:MAG: trigger factor [Acidobacteriota bacterium]
MSVVLSIDEVGPCRKQLKIEVPAPAVEAETKRVVDEFRRKAKLPGFRKGKVPRELVEQRFQSDIEQEVIDRLVPRYWRQAEAEKELDPLMPPSLEDVDLQPGAELTFVASVETRPEIQVGDLENFELPELEVTPTPEEIDASLDELRRSLAEWVAVERPAARGDLVVGEMTPQNGDSDAEPEEQTISFEVGDPQVWEELTLEATGKTAGQSTEVVRRQGEGEDAVEQRFSLHIAEVKERDLPPADDALAARVGEFEDLAALKEALGKRLEQEKRQERRQQREKSLTDQLRERHPLTLPRGVVDQEIEAMLRDYASGLAMRGVDLEKTQLDWREMGEKVRPQAENHVHSRLILDAVAKDLELEVTEAEFERTLANLARAEGKTTVAVRQALDRAGRLGPLRAQLRREKTLRHLMGDSPELAMTDSDDTVEENEQDDQD